MFCAERGVAVDDFFGDGPVPFGLMAALSSKGTRNISVPEAAFSSYGVSSSLSFGVMAALGDPPLGGP